MTHNASNPQQLRCSCNCDYSSHFTVGYFPQQNKPLQIRPADPWANTHRKMDLQDGQQQHHTKHFYAAPWTTQSLSGQQSQVTPKSP